MISAAKYTLTGAFLCVLLVITDMLPVLGQAQLSDSDTIPLINGSEGRKEIMEELSQLFNEKDPRYNISFGEKAYELGVQSDDEEMMAQAAEVIGWGYFYTYDFKKAADYLILSLTSYKKVNNPEKISKLSQNIGTAFIQANDFYQAERYLSDALQMALKDNNKENQIICYNNLGLAKSMQGKPAEALDYFEKASEICKSIDDSANYSRSLNRIGMTFWSLGIYDKALSYMLQSTDLKNPGDLKGLAINYNNIGAIYKDLEENENALKYYKKALVLYRQIKDSLDQPSALNNIGTIYADKNNNDSALFYYEAALKISTRLGDDLQSAKTKHNIAMIYRDEGQINQADKYFHEFLDLSRKAGYKDGIAHALYGMALNAQEQGNLKLAELYLTDCIAVSDSMNNLPMLKSANLLMSELQQGKKNYREALGYYLKYEEMKDSLFNSEKNKVISEMQAKYETEKKQQENDLLLKENELKNRKINTLYIIITGFIVLIFIIALLILQYRKNSRNKKLLLESETARLAEKIEHQDRELATNALMLSRNFDFLTKLLNDLKGLSSHIDDEGTRNLVGIIKNIQQLDNSSIWNEFEMRFQQIHAGFYKTLIEKFPTLTTNELKLCTLLKLGLNTKEIAMVTYRNIRTIEAARLRLRKKFTLDVSDDLTAFIQKF